MKKTAAKTAVKSIAKTTSAPVAPTAPGPSAPALPAPVALAATVPAPTSVAEVTIDAKVDVGYGNALFLRGQGPGLNWDHGVPLICVDGKTWRWSQKVKDPITFKLLLNDKVWSTGNDLTAKPGQRVEVAPSFS